MLPCSVPIMNLVGPACGLYSKLHANHTHHSHDTHQSKQVSSASFAPWMLLSKHWSCKGLQGARDFRVHATAESVDAIKQGALLGVWGCSELQRLA